MVKVGNFSSMFEAPPWKIYVDRENLRVKILSKFRSVCFYIYDSGGYKKQYLSVYVFYTNVIYLSN